MTGVLTSIKQLEPGVIWPQARINIDLFTKTETSYALVPDIWFPPCSLDFLFDDDKPQGLLAMTEPGDSTAVYDFLHDSLNREIGIRYELFYPGNKAQNRPVIQLLHIAFFAKIIALGCQRYCPPKTRGYNILLGYLSDDPTIPEFSTEAVSQESLPTLE